MIHISWILLIINFNFSRWTIYLLFYSLIISFITNKNIILFNRLIQLNFYSNFFYKIIFLFFFLNLIGIPPFPGFLLKWISLNLINLYFIIPTTFLLLRSLLSSFVYLNSCFPFLLKNSIFNLFFINLSYLNWYIINFFILLIFFPLI